ncbi:MAG: hypothetical protein M9885_03120 [Burkholderiaceae bacterium]|nr:hypothetical protein [Burkholderiaceae bacterium]
MSRKAKRLNTAARIVDARHDGRIQLERLPAYAPELNPVEYVFGYAKQRELANLCASTIDEVRRYARRRLASMQRRPRLIRAFWQQAELTF